MKSKMENNNLKINNRTKSNMQTWFHKTFTLVLINVLQNEFQVD